MNDFINMFFFVSIIILFVAYFRDINYKKIITLIKDKDKLLTNNYQINYGNYR
jgi:hypothetical protein